MSGTVYRLYDRHDNLLYVGSTGSLGARLSSHRCTKDWWPEVMYHTTLDYETRQEALEAEQVAIKTEAPIHNKPLGRPKGPPKKKIVVWLEVPVFEWLDGKASAKDESPASYLARNVTQQHVNDAKTRSGHHEQ